MRNNFLTLLLTGAASCALAIGASALAQETPPPLPMLPLPTAAAPAGETPPDVPTPPIPADQAPMPSLPVAPAAEAPALMPLPTVHAEPAPAAPAPALMPLPTPPAEAMPAQPVPAAPLAELPAPAPAVDPVPAAPAMPAPAAEALSMPLPTAPEAAPVDAAATPAVIPAAPAPVSDDAEWSGTLMFDAERVAKLNELYQQYLIAQSRNVKPGTKAGPGLEERIKKAIGKEKEIPEEVLQFALDSIMYYTDADWSIWVNGQRYFRDEAMEGFTVGKSQLAVTEANEKEVNFIWTPISESFDKVHKRWDDKQLLSKAGPSPQLALNERVEFDPTAQTVTILMRPNQTFVSNFMSVLEGKDDRTPVAPKATGKPGAKDAKPANPADPAAAPADGAANNPAAAAAAAAPVGAGEPTLSQINAMPDGPAKDKALASHLSNQYKSAFPGMSDAVEKNERLEPALPTNP